MVTLGRDEAAKRTHRRPLSAAGPRGRRPTVFEPSAWRRESRRQYALERERAGTAEVELAGVGRLERGWLRVRYGRPG